MLDFVSGIVVFIYQLPYLSVGIYACDSAKGTQGFPTLMMRMKRIAVAEVKALKWFSLLLPFCSRCLVDREDQLLPGLFVPNGKHYVAVYS